MSEILRLYGLEVPSNKRVRTQVYLATHDGADRRLPLRNRSFISFSYGGKLIEDFSLIATLRSSRMDRSLYGEFSDNTSTYDVINGQFYWGTHFTKNTLSLLLSTDEMTENELYEFKHWFVPGIGRELVLAEYPNRAIHARINKTPEYHMLPFEKKVTKKFMNQEYEVSTTVYRGNIDLEFVMDDPFWYSIYNVLPSYGADGTEQKSVTLGFDNSNPSAPNNALLSNRDYLKVILEDGVPTREMINMAGSTYIITGEVKHNVQALIVGTAQVGNRIGSTSLRLSSTGDLNKASMHLYYPGNAPAPTLLSFDILPIVTNGYILNPLNSIYNRVNNTDYPNYNTIKVGKSEFKFTTPSLLTGYNQAMDIITTMKNGVSVIDVRILLNEGINEYYSRSWALGVLNYLKAFRIGISETTSLITDADAFLRAFKDMMRQFLLIKTSDDYKILRVHFEFNSKTGEATGKFKIRKFKDGILDDWNAYSRYTGEWNIGPLVDLTAIKQEGNAENYLIYDKDLFTKMFHINSPDSTDYLWYIINHGFNVYDNNGVYQFTIRPFLEYTEEVEIIENVGDMVYGKYLYLEDKNWYNDDGFVVPDRCTKVSTNYPQESGLFDFDIQYKYMYL